jgi:hypothetical protein
MSDYLDYLRQLGLDIGFKDRRAPSLTMPGNQPALPLPESPPAMSPGVQQILDRGPGPGGRIEARTPRMVERLEDFLGGDRGAGSRRDAARALSGLAELSPAGTVMGIGDMLQGDRSLGATLSAIPMAGSRGRALASELEQLGGRAARSAGIGHNRGPSLVDGTVGRATPDVMFEGVSPHDFSPSQWGRFGEAHGVPNLGPMDDAAWQASLQPVTSRSGKTYTVPGGLESKEPFTYYDELHLKGQGINPNDLEPGQHQAIHDRFVSSKSTDEPISDERLFNQLAMGMISPNQPLTPNELAVGRIMAKGPEDIEAVGRMVPWRYGDAGVTKEDRLDASRRIAESLGLQAAGRGGIGAVGSADYSRIAEMAQMLQDQPAFFRMAGAAEGGANKAENWANYVERLSNQVPGLSAKTGSFAGVWQNPGDAAISAIDRHMARKFTTEMFSSPEEAQTFGKPVFDKFNAERGTNVGSFDELLAQEGGRGAFDDAIFAYLNNHPEMKLRDRKGNYNPRVPENLRRDDWVREPDKVATISDPYKRVLAANSESAGQAGQSTFSNQWMLWDRIRNRLEPHEVMFPGLEKLPRMSLDQVKRTREAQKEAGYFASSGEVRPMAASKGAYFALPLLGLPALMQQDEEERRRRGS